MAQLPAEGANAASPLSSVRLMSSDLGALSSIKLAAVAEAADKVRGTLTV